MYPSTTLNDAVIKIRTAFEAMGRSPEVSSMIGECFRELASIINVYGIKDRVGQLSDTVEQLKLTIDGQNISALRAENEKQKHQLGELKTIVADFICKNPMESEDAIRYLAQM